MPVRFGWRQEHLGCIAGIAMTTISLTLKAQADYLVSGDKDLLEAPPVQGLRVVSVHQTLEVLGL